MTASPSLHLSAGMDFRHCLDSRKRPGKNTDPAARMVSMVPGDLSEAKSSAGNLVLEIRHSVPSLKNTKHQTVDKQFILISLVATPTCMHFAAFTKIKNKAHYQSPTYVAIYYSSSTKDLAICSIKMKWGKGKG